MGRKKKEIEIEDKKFGSKRALVYGEKRFFYSNSDEKRFALRKIKAWKVLEKEKQNDN